MNPETRPETQPWIALADSIAERDLGQLELRLHSLDPVDLVRALSRLTDDQRSGLLELVQPVEAADLIERIPESQAVDALEMLEPETAARILEQLPSNEQADLIGELEPRDAEAILAEMPAEEADEVRELAAYEEGSAGSLMLTEFLCFSGDCLVEEVIADLRANAEEYADYDVQYIYVVTESGALAGVLRIRDLLLSPPGRAIERMMIAQPKRVRDDSSLEELHAFFGEHHLFGAPVVDAADHLLGVVRRAAVDEAQAEQTEEDFRHAQGIVGGEELRSMPLLLRSRRRLSWLSVNVLLNIAAASVIAMHQETLEAVIALAVFLPIISDMSGCSGSQAVAVSIRELTLGVIQPRDIRRVIGKELAAGLLNGLALGLLLGGVAWIWKGNAFLGLVTGGALALNTVVAVCIGGGIPLVLKRFGRDPALASGPILTTVTDACGFFLVLSLASAFLSRLA